MGIEAVDTTTVYLIAGAAFLASWLVKRWLQSTYSKWSRIPNRHGITGAQTAAAILARNGVDNVRIESVKGRLTDHYDPEQDILRLSSENFHQTSVAAMAVSAHEAGHAVQDAHRDIRLALRRFLVPIATLGSRLGPMIVFFGFISGSGFMLRLGALLLAGMVLFQLATLPVEFNASRRALRNLRELGLIAGEQEAGTRRVLTAAALTYVAAATMSFAYLATLMAQGRRSAV
jgi:Zn-dependent membrane protease YugP